nr:MAG TPA: hypothetical protein [Caudoviricetes sp.]
MRGWSPRRTSASSTFPSATCDPTRTTRAATTGRCGPL